MHSRASSSGAWCLPQQGEPRPIVALDSVSHKLWVIPLLGHKLDVVIIYPLPLFFLCTIRCYILKHTCSS